MRVGNSIYVRWPFFKEEIVGQLVKTPLPPNRRCLGTSLAATFQSASCNLLKFPFIIFLHVALTENNLDIPARYVELKYFIDIGADTFNKQYYSITRNDIKCCGNK